MRIWATDDYFLREKARPEAQQKAEEIDDRNWTESQHPRVLREAGR